MKQNNTIRIASIATIGFSAFSIAAVSGMAFISPQAVMDLVGVQLPNNDAYSSIRGVFGGVGITVSAVLLRLSYKSLRYGLSFLALFWGAYAASRLITMMAEGPLGAFGTQWLVIEASFCLLSMVLLLLQKRQPQVA